MKKFLLSLILIALIVCNIFLLVKIRDGSEIIGTVQSDDTSSSSAPSSVSSEASDISSESQQDTAEVQSNSEVSSDYSEKLHMPLEFPEAFEDHSSAKIGDEIGNYAANAYNGGYAVLYDKKVYYIDMRSSNYLYFCRNNLSQYSYINKINSMYINVYQNNIFYVNQSDGTLWTRPVSKNSHKQIGQMRAVCPVAVNGYIYYVSPPDENSMCGDIRRLNISDYTDEKISPDGYVCENIIPCGEFILFVSVGKEDKSICVLNTATSEVTPLYNGDVSDINFSNGSLWFVRHLGSSDEICRVDAGSDEIKAVTAATKIDNLIVANGYAFYIVSDSDSAAKCVRIAVDGNTPEVIYKDKNKVISSFNIMGGFIYFEISDAKKIRRLVPGKTSVTILP
ncbi:MAG: DUF5050 domain-containing protein [Firmicutes bacterium]|nr:DUF5050 domain-containing protein [Bacillota bacterium]